MIIILNILKVESGKVVKCLKGQFIFFKLITLSKSEKLNKLIFKSVSLWSSVSLKDSSSWSLMFIIWRRFDDLFR